MSIYVCVLKINSLFPSFCPYLVFGIGPTVLHFCFSTVTCATHLVDLHTTCIRRHINLQYIKSDLQGSFALQVHFKGGQGRSTDTLLNETIAGADTWTWGGWDSTGSAVTRGGVSGGTIRTVDRKDTHAATSLKVTGRFFLVCVTQFPL